MLAHPSGALPARRRMCMLSSSFLAAMKRLRIRIPALRGMWGNYLKVAEDRPPTPITLLTNFKNCLRRDRARSYPFPMPTPHSHLRGEILRSSRFLQSRAHFSCSTRAVAPVAYRAKLSAAPGITLYDWDQDLQQRVLSELKLNLAIAEVLSLHCKEMKLTTPKTNLNWHTI